MWKYDGNCSLLSVVQQPRGAGAGAAAFGAVSFAQHLPGTAWKTQMKYFSRGLLLRQKGKGVWCL